MESQENDITQEEYIFAENIAMFGDGAVRYVDYITVGETIGIETAKNYILGENTPVTVQAGKNFVTGKNYVLIAFKSQEDCSNFIQDGPGRTDVRVVIDSYFEEEESEYYPCQVSQGLRKYADMNLQNKENFAIAFRVKKA